MYDHSTFKTARRTKITNSIAMKWCRKCNIFVCSILIFGVHYVLSAGESSEEETSSNKVLPIILMKKSEIFEFEPPNAVSLEPVLLFWNNMDFYAQDGLHERYFCPADKTQRGRIKKTREKMAGEEKGHSKPLVSDNCLFENSLAKLGKFFGVMPRCRQEPEPLISKIFLTIKDIDKKPDLSNLYLDWSSCGFKGENKLYRSGYQIWLETKTSNPITNINPPLFKLMTLPHEDVIDYEIFRFCYDHSAQDVLYTKHRIISPGLLSNKKLKEELEKTYPTSFSKYDNDELDFQNIITTYDQVRVSATTTLLDYQMEKLIPPGDFSFILWKKPIFHYLNEKPMHVKLIKMWGEINKIIQDRAKSAHLEYDIYTGTFDILIEEGKNKTSKTEDEIRIPQIWIKIVQIDIFKPKYKVDVNEGIAIIANNHMNDELEEKILSELCRNEHTYEYRSKNKPTEKNEPTEKDEPTDKMEPTDKNEPTDKDEPTDKNEPTEKNKSTEKSEPTVSKLKKYTYIRSCLVTKQIQNLFGLDLEIRGDIVLF